MKLITTVNIERPLKPLSLSDKLFSLGSCFADNMAGRLAAAGFDVCANPFGTLYNPESIRMAVERLDSGKDFTLADCVEMGAGAGRICSFEHHTSFARASAEEFLANANARLAEARSKWQQADCVIITLGTSFVWFHDGRVVANCLKRPAAEFNRRMLEISEIEDCLWCMAAAHPEKRFILTVSPIRHLGDGAHANTLSKARLLLSAASVADSAAARLEYFPSYEIMLDELRDYRFYAEDLVHPSPLAIQYIWERFLENFVSPADLPRIAANEKAARSQAHRPNLI